MAVRRHVNTVVVAESVYLDPMGCDSTVSYKIINGKRYMWGTVQLADCNRKIEWYFNSRGNALAKADKAIAALQAFRDRYAAALAAKKKLVRKRVVKK